MKIVVIGGTGLIGSRVVARLRQRGHVAVPASPASGVDTLTGQGLAEVLAGAQVVVDVANSPSFEDKAVLDFFQTSSRNLLAAEAEAGVGHHVALSVVGTGRLPGSGYFRAKLAQQALIEAAAIPYTIVQATQFFEFLPAIAQAGADGETVRLPSAVFQPIAADDVAAMVADAALATPIDGIVEIAGPERIGMAALVGRFLDATGDRRTVVADAQAPYFGIVMDDRSLTPAGESPRLGKIDFGMWMAQARAANR